MKILFFKLGLYALFIIFPFETIAQSDSLYNDSLKKVLLTEKEDTNKVNSLNELASLLINKSDYANSLQYANKSLTLAKTLNFKRGEGIAYKNLGSSVQEFEEALKNLNTALNIFKELQSEQDIADSYYRIGGAYFYLQQNMPEAIKNILIALKQYEKSGQKISIANCYKLLGMIYSNLGETAEALAQSTNALKIYKEIKDSLGAAYTYNVIGGIYLNAHKEPEAIQNYLIALGIYKQIGKKGPDFGTPWTEGLIGAVYLSQAEKADASGQKIEADNKFKEALALFNSRFSLEEEGGITHTTTYIQLGRYYMDIGNRESGTLRNKYILESKMNYEKALESAKQPNYKTVLANCYFSLSHLNVLLNNYKEAYNNQNNFYLYRDSMLNEENTKKITETKMQYDFDKKDAVARAEQDKKDADGKRIKNQQYFAIAALGIVVLAVIVIAMIQFRNNKQKQKANIALQQQKQKVETTLSELKSTQSQLIQSEKMASLGELTAGIAHEIQNPLNFVNNFSEVNTELIDELQKEVDKGNLDEVKAIAKDIRENEQKINHHGKRADKIVKGMLQHSRSGSAVKEPTDMNKLSDEYLRLAYQGLRAKDKNFNATLKTDFDESIGKINIIPQDIGRVLLNLYNNAFYAVNEKSRLNIEDFEPTVSVSTKKINNTIEIRVSDNGNGIDQKIVDKIFQPFFTTKPTGQGTGLGLSLSYDIIKAHGGEIRVETKEGEGSEFVIQL
ncbi:MAG: ATP-binding protein [Ferruginibacter sp.]